MADKNPILTPGTFHPVGEMRDRCKTLDNPGRVAKGHNFQKYRDNWDAIFSKKKNDDAKE